MKTTATLLLVFLLTTINISAAGKMPKKALTLVHMRAASAAWSYMSFPERNDPRIKRMDYLVKRVRNFEDRPYFARRYLSGGMQNLFTLVDHWNEIEQTLFKSTGSRRNAEVSYPGEIQFRATGAISGTMLSATRYTGFTQNETSTAWCGTNVVVAFNDTSSEVATLLGPRGVSLDGYSYSNDTAASFTYAGTPTPGTGTNTFMLGDPSVACADSGHFYLSSIWMDGTNNITGISLSRSTDGGQTFAAPAVIVAKNAMTHFVDKDWMALDPQNPNDIYVTYTDFDYSGSVCGTDTPGNPIPRYAIEMVTSTDGGATFGSTPTVVEQVCANASSPEALVEGSQVAVDLQGVVYVSWEEYGMNGGTFADRKIRIAKSIDGGASFGAPVTVSEVDCAGNCADLQGFIRSTEFPTMAVGEGSANNGFVYIAWDDGVDQVPDFLSTTGFYGFTDILLSESKDGGATWSAPVRVNNDPEGNGSPYTDQFEPALATDKTGRLAVCFYDRRLDPNNFLIDRYCASSRDDGMTWTDTKFTPVSFPSVVGQDAFLSPDYMGDYDVLARDFTNVSPGFMDAYGDNASGNPVVVMHRY